MAQNKSATDEVKKDETPEINLEQTFTLETVEPAMHHMIRTLWSGQNPAIIDEEVNAWLRDGFHIASTHVLQVHKEGHVDILHILER